MCHKLEARFFRELGSLDPAEVCRRALCRYDRDRECYLLEAWAGEYEIHPGRAEIRSGSSGVLPVTIEAGLSIIFYLLRSRDIPLRNEWISEKDLPGGLTFFRGPHAVPARLIAQRFANDREGFKNACRGRGGKPLDLGRAAYEFRILPRVPAAVLFWEADQEFEAQARLLFDRTISFHLPLDVIFGLSVETCERIASGAISPVP